MTTVRSEAGEGVISASYSASLNIPFVSDGGKLTPYRRRTVDPLSFGSTTDRVDQRTLARVEAREEGRAQRGGLGRDPAAVSR